MDAVYEVAERPVNVATVAEVKGTPSVDAEPNNCALISPEIVAVLVVVVWCPPASTTVTLT
jgi:hypothetical protein